MLKIQKATQIRQNFIYLFIYLLFVAIFGFFKKKKGKKLDFDTLNSLVQHI